MVILKKFKKTVVVSIVLSSFVFGAGSAFAYNIWYGGGFGPHPTSTTVRPLSTFDSASKTAFINAASQWSNAGAGNLVSIGSDTSNTSYPNDNNQNEVTKGARGSNDYLMQCNATSTSLVWNGLYWSNTIFEADIDVNTSYAWGNGSATLYDIGQVFTHELGHLLGLDHSNVSGATMWSGSAPGETYKRSIEQDDIDGILNIY
jgi:hypothetical protein